MPCPFPGMDPWLEAPYRWPGFHDTLVIKTVEVLQPQLRQRGYYANPGERVWVSQSDREVGPDVVVVHAKELPVTPATAASAVLDVDEPVRIELTETEFHEGIVEIYDAATHSLVTYIEYLSPANKSDPQGRALYEQKREELTSADINLVEIDLLRRGPHVLDVPQSVVQALKPWHYLVNTVRSSQTGYEVYPILLRQPLPRIRLPLKADDADAVLNLQEVFTKSYEISPYPERLDYSESPSPPLPPDDAAWARRLLVDHDLLTA